MSNIMNTLKKPIVMVILALVVGLLIGLFVGWVAWPTQLTNAPMTLTRQDLQDDFLRMTLDSLQVNGDTNLAISRYQQLGANAALTLDGLKTDPSVDQPTLTAFAQLVQAQPGPVTPLPSEDGTKAALVWGSILAVVLVAIALILYFWLFRIKRVAPEDMTPAMVAAEHSRSVEKTDYSTGGAEPPVAQYVTTYVLGDDLFDDSFSIDAATGEFLGECGVGISETVGVGDPKKVAAFEVWMFDKNDIQTVTKVLMSARAFADPTFRAKLEPKGELVQVDAHKQVVLETQTLQMIATVSDMQYGQGALPDGSYFDRITIELAIWSKK